MCRVGTAKVETRRVLTGMKTLPGLQVLTGCVLASIPMPTKRREPPLRITCIILHHRNRRDDALGHGTTLNKEDLARNLIHGGRNTAGSCHTGLTRPGETLMRRGPPGHFGPKERRASNPAVYTQSTRFESLTDYHRSPLVFPQRLPKPVLSDRQRSSSSASHEGRSRASFLLISLTGGLTGDNGIDARAQDIREMDRASVPQCARSEDSVRTQKNARALTLEAVIRGQNSYGKSAHWRRTKHEQHKHHFTNLYS